MCFSTKKKLAGSRQHNCLAFRSKTGTPQHQVTSSNIWQLNSFVQCAQQFALLCQLSIGTRCPMIHRFCRARGIDCPDTETLDPHHGRQRDLQFEALLMTFPLVHLTERRGRWRHQRGQRWDIFEQCFVVVIVGDRGWRCSRGSSGGRYRCGCERAVSGEGSTNRADQHGLRPRLACDTRGKDAFRPPRSPC